MDKISNDGPDLETMPDSNSIQFLAQEAKEGKWLSFESSNSRFCIFLWWSMLALRP